MSYQRFWMRFRPDFFKRLSICFLLSLKNYKKLYIFGFSNLTSMCNGKIVPIHTDLQSLRIAQSRVTKTLAVWQHCCTKMLVVLVVLLVLRKCSQIFTLFSCKTPLKFHSFCCKKSIKKLCCSV